MDRPHVAEILKGESDEIEELKANLPVLEGFIRLARELDALPEISKRFYEDSRSLFQATSSHRSMSELEDLLSPFFGPPVKPPGKSLPRKLRKSPAVHNLGGIEKDQCLFLLPMKAGEFYAALWPWQRKKGNIEIHMGYCSDGMTDEVFLQLETLVKRSLSHSAFQRMGTAIGGSIRGISLPSFLQMAEMEQASFTLCISAGGYTGHLHLKEGQLIDAETGEWTGHVAAHRIISWEDGTIEIGPADTARKDRIRQPMMHVLMESLKLKDEIKRSADIPPAPPPKARPCRTASSAESRPKRLVRLERTPAPRVTRKKVRLANVLSLLFGTLIVAGCGIAIGWYMINTGAFRADQYDQLRLRVDKTEAPEEKIGMLQAFLQEDPHTRHASEIKSLISEVSSRIEDHDFEQMILMISSLPVDDSYEATAVSLYGDFLEKHPHTRLQQRISAAVRDTKQLVDQYYYEELGNAAGANFTQRLQVYKQHQTRIPHEPFQSDIEILIAAIGRQHLDYLKTESERCDQQQRWPDCLAQFDSFLADFNTGPLTQEAELLKAELQDKRDLAELKKLASQSGTDYMKASQAYLEYLTHNPQSSQRATLEKEIARLNTTAHLQRQWQTVKTQALDTQNSLVDRIQLLDRYLREHTTGPYAAEAQDLMQRLESQRLALLQQSKTQALRQEETTRIERENEIKVQQQLKAQQARRLLAQQLSESERFRNNGNATFTDQTTGLTWTLLDSLQELGTCLTYPAAQQHIRNLASQIQGTWRFPTASELAGIYKQIPFFPDSGAQWYWSSEAYARGHHSVADVVTAKPETVFQREYRRQDQCGAVRAVLVK